MMICFKGEYYTIPQLAQKYCACEGTIYKLISECTEKELERRLNLHKQQHLNKNKTYEYEGKRYTLKEISYATGLGEQTIRNRIKLGWDIKDVFEIPVLKMGEKRKK